MAPAGQRTSVLKRVVHAHGDAPSSVSSRRSRVTSAEASPVAGGGYGASRMPAGAVWSLRTRHTRLPAWLCGRVCTLFTTTAGCCPRSSKPERGRGREQTFLTVLGEGALMYAAAAARRQVAAHLAGQAARRTRPCCRTDSTSGLWLGLGRLGAVIVPINTA